MSQVVAISRASQTRWLVCFRHQEWSEQCHMAGVCYAPTIWPLRHRLQWNLILARSTILRQRSLRGRKVWRSMDLFWNIILIWGKRHGDPAIGTGWVVVKSISPDIHLRSSLCYYYMFLSVLNKPKNSCTDAGFDQKQQKRCLRSECLTFPSHNNGFLWHGWWETWAVATKRRIKEEVGQVLYQQYHSGDLFYLHCNWSFFAFSFLNNGFIWIVRPRHSEKRGQ